ncbi:MAG: hypothetical protein U0694_07840 [Anaerolineae bacterium]
MMMETYFTNLRSAQQQEDVPAMLDTLTRIAAACVDDGETERAAEILTLVVLYPLNKYTRLRAESLLLGLKAEICPRVILDAETRAQEITLDDMVLEVLSTAA